MLAVVVGVRRVVRGHRAADLTARTGRVGGLYGFGFLYGLVVWPEFRRTYRCGGGFGAVAVRTARSRVRMRRGLVKTRVVVFQIRRSVCCCTIVYRLAADFRA